MNNVIIIKNIQTWLKENQRPQSWLAEQIGLSTAMISQIFSGTRKLQTKHLLRILKVTGLQMATLTSASTDQLANDIHYELRGAFSNKNSEKTFKRLLWDIKRYVDLEETIND
ncbi:helix-turn-helix transcriptional regulator [Lactiplantibacillus sp. WILCCON 0030]|uniref:Helix-turn-helix transcriptional regulator n=1 Tax=Lactiplantibacillus brownii TaxID=3069269 RepID=A0ABU1A7M8_9LACO|nr:helix-turn-helix transcriptional regulator [Lactiplantibacillus brownii]MDQ7936951.1 helix-turn-helix transcriptional regulator [Lactiplantibacillus brownii]